MISVRVIGGGLAGVEAAYQLLIRGFGVDLYEMRPVKMTPIHRSSRLAELVCSNSLKSENIHTSQGLFKQELKLLNSLTLAAAKQSRVPAGGALAVERTSFSKYIENHLLQFPNFRIYRKEIDEIRQFDINSTGPLTSNSLSREIATYVGREKLYFYDAVAPIVSKDSIDMSHAFYAARYDKGSADYINCPIDKENYYYFVDKLIESKKVILKDFEKDEIFSACMPIEEIARKGRDSLRFGPLRPVGFKRKLDSRPYAIVQLRKEDNYDYLYNIVGFQTNLTFSEQEKVFRIIPALKKARFIRYGLMHKNLFIDSPSILSEFLNLKSESRVFFAGQITGVEGYLESAMSGIIAGINMARLLKGMDMVKFSLDTLTGSLINYISSFNSNFQPMHVSYDLLGFRSSFKTKEEKREEYKNRALEALLQDILKFKINADIRTQPDFVV